MSDDRRGVRPIRRHVLLLDDQPEHDEGGVVVAAGIRRTNLDFYVVRIGTEEQDPGFGQGDRIVLADPDAGRRLMLDGVAYRVVRLTDIIAVVS